MATLADDETPIKVLPNTNDWCENYAMGGYDPKSGIGHFFSMGRWIPDLNLWRSVTIVSLPDGRVLTSKSFGYGTAQAASSRELTFTVVEPKRRFELAFDGVAGAFAVNDLITNGYHETKPKRLKFKFDFVSEEPLWDIGGHAGAAEDFVGAGHTEQQGIVSGTLTYGDETFTLHPSIGTRDHSRGVRNMSLYRRHCWHNGVFPSGVRFYSYYFEVQNTPPGTAMQLAAVSKNGKLYPASIKPKWSDSVLRPTKEEALLPIEIEIESELGVMSLKGIPKNIMPLSTSHTPYDVHVGWNASYPFESFLFFEQSTEWHCNGEVGIGHSERGIRT